MSSDRPALRRATALRPARPWFRALRLAGLLAAVLGISGGARAQVEGDEGFWFMLLAQGSFGGANDGAQEGANRYRWWLDVQPRAGDELAFRNQLLVRPGLGYAFDPRTVGWLGYAWIRSELPDGRYTTENRVWQQLTWSPDVDLFGLASRTRLEQRFPEDRSETGWRFRQFFKMSQPLSEGSRISLVGYDEVFFDLNDTDWGQRSGFSQNRLFAGLGWRPEALGGATFELGYLNQYLRRPGEDGMYHILSCNLLLSF
jgi:hypothetical protein